MHKYLILHSAEQREHLPIVSMGFVGAWGPTHNAILLGICHHQSNGEGIMNNDFWPAEWHQQNRQLEVDQLNLAFSDLVRGGKDRNREISAVFDDSEHMHRFSERVRDEIVDLSAW